MEELLNRTKPVNQKVFIIRMYYQRRMIKTEDAFGKTMETIIWLCKKQNTDKNNHGSWSMESDLRKLFITTNQVACTLIDLQISINDESIIFATRWVEKQLQNDLIPIQDRANALELFSLIKQK